MLAFQAPAQVLFNGVVQGAVYGLLAIAIVLTYRSTRVINFAVGGMGLIGTGLLVILVENHGVPYWPALALALLAGIAYGAAVELIVIRRLFRAPRVIVLVATIGVAQVSLAILNLYPDLVGKGLKFPVPSNSKWEVGSIQISGPQLAILVVTPAVALALGWVINRTLLGRTVTATASNPDLARIAGISPKVVSTCVWSAAGLLATIAMTLIGGLSASAGSLTTLGPNTLLRALVAALIARFRSFPAALAAGIGIGVGEKLLNFNVTTQPGLIDVLLLVLVVVVVSLQPRERGDTEVFAFTPKVDPMPERLRSIFWVRNVDRLALVVPIAFAMALPLVVTQASRQLLYASIIAFAICALSLTVLTGWAGQLSLGQMAFAGIGALLAAAFTNGIAIKWRIGGVQLLNVELYGIPFAIAIPLAATITALLAVIIGAGALRARGLLLAVTTFAFAIAASAWIYHLDLLSQGNATSVPFPRGELFGLDLANLRSYYYVVLAVLVAMVAMLGRIRRSGAGRVTLAVRDNPTSAAAYTVRPAAVKLRAFALSGWIAGLGGALLAGALQQISLTDANFLVAGSLALVAMVVIGGMGSTIGAIIGALWVVGLPSLATGNAVVPLLSSGVGLLVLLLYFPGGLVQIVHRARSGLYRYLERRLPPPAKAAIPAVPPPTVGRAVRPTVEHEVVLKTTDLTVNYGGLVANNNVSIEVRRDEIVALIGTNGSGKSTFMNATGGFLAASGRVELLGQDVSEDQPATRARKGLGRTFQAATLFPELTVRESVQVALEARGRSSLTGVVLFSPRNRKRERAKRAEAAELIDFLGLGRYAETTVSDLSTGTRRIVELAALLALDARMLCLDEPTAGIAQRESEAMGPLLVEVRRHLGAAMLIIEHDMPLIMGMSDRVYCLEAGRVIAEGDPHTVRNDPAVIASYLGTDERTIERSDTVRR